MGNKKIPDFMRHQRLSNYSVEGGLIDYIDKKALAYDTTGSDMLSRIIKFYMEYNDIEAVVEEKRKKAEAANKAYDEAKGALDQKIQTAHLHAESMAIKYYTGVFEGVSKRDYVYFEMSVKSGLSPDVCLNILEEAGKRQVERILEHARKTSPPGETGIGKA